MTSPATFCRDYVRLRKMRQLAERIYYAYPQVRACQALTGLAALILGCLVRSLLSKNRIEKAKQI